MSEDDKKSEGEKRKREAGEGDDATPNKKNARTDQFDDAPDDEEPKTASVDVPVKSADNQKETTPPEETNGKEEPKKEATAKPAAASASSASAEVPDQAGATKESSDGANVDSSEAGAETKEALTPAATQSPAPDPSTQAVDPSVQATIVNPEQIIEEKGEVSPLYVGRVIGKGGEMIRDLQARSGARIDVDQNVPPGAPRVITYRGTRRTIDFAKRLVAMLSKEGANEAHLPLGKAKREFLAIPASCVGKVIGRGGEMIRELQSRSHGKIQIDHTGASGVSPDQKQITVTGTEESVLKAREMILFLVSNPQMDAMQSLNLLADDKLRGGGQWGSGPPYPNLPNGGINMLPYMAEGGGGGGHYQQGGPGAYGAAPMAGGGNPYGQQQHGGNYYNAAGGAGGLVAEVMFARKNYMGRIIGQKGVTINDLQQRSGCDIQINQDVPPGQDCEISIRGSREGVETAKQMINDIIEIGPNHPYAGGMQQGQHGGNGGGYQQYNHQNQGGYQQQPQQSYGGYQQPQGGYQQGGQYSQPQQQQTYGAGAYGQQQQQPGAYGQQQQTMMHQQQQQQQPYGSSVYGQQQPQQQQTYGTGAYGQQHQQQPQGGQGSIPPHGTVAPPPSGWKPATSPDGQVYYYNEQTGETQWEKPVGMP